MNLLSVLVGPHGGSKSQVAQRRSCVANVAEIVHPLGALSYSVRLFRVIVCSDRDTYIKCVGPVQRIAQIDDGQIGCAANCQQRQQPESENHPGRISSMFVPDEQGRMLYQQPCRSKIIYEQMEAELGLESGRGS